MVLLTWIVVIVAVVAVIVYLWAWNKAPEPSAPPGEPLPVEPAVTFGTPFLEPTLTLGPAPEPVPAEPDTAEAPEEHQA